VEIVLTFQISQTMAKRKIYLTMERRKKHVNYPKETPRAEVINYHHLQEFLQVYLVTANFFQLLRYVTNITKGALQLCLFFFFYWSRVRTGHGILEKSWIFIL